MPGLSKGLVSKYGSLFARNRANIKALRDQGPVSGVYVLFDGSMPVYIGRGTLYRRIRRHRQSKRRKHFWDHFSWFAIPDRRFEADVEALLLRMLPFYLRSLNKQRTRFRNAEHVQEKKQNQVAEVIDRPHSVVRSR